MKKITLRTIYKKRLADTITPVSVYLRLRDQFANSILLESSDYHGNENNFSYICCDPIARFEVNQGQAKMEFPDGQRKEIKLDANNRLADLLYDFSQSFEVEEGPSKKFVSNGLFGYQSYDAVRYYENISIDTFPNEKRAIPDVLYFAYRFVIAINHFHNELYVFEHLLPQQESEIDRILSFINRQYNGIFDFQSNEDETSNFTDAEYLEAIRLGQNHCARGDVFQIVLSRRFSQSFRGDEFNVYRALRSINPSPYLFYFDMGSFKVFGSSPEAQIVIQDDVASIHPIAGTFKRTGDDEADAEQARKLAADPKENAEHMMLVDLARNDLSRHGSEVEVVTLKEIQFFSHLIHLVSKVNGKIQDTQPLQLVGDTFPAGTLSGAPKYKAMELINTYEKENRGYYGGCIGFLGFNGNFNHAIMIRSFLSKGNRLYYQAGAGVVFKSVPQKELEEVHHKLRALRKSIELANQL